MALSTPDFSHRSVSELSEESGVDAIVPIIGYRAWALDCVTLTLKSLWRGDGWKPLAAHHATCNSPKGWLASRALGRDLSIHDAPQPKCECGIHAVSHPGHLNEMYFGKHLCVVLGTVALWGRVVVADLGWRAEVAYPLALTLELPGTHGSWTEMDHHVRRMFIESAGERYRVPIVERWPDAFASGLKALW